MSASCRHICGGLWRSYSQRYRGDWIGYTAAVSAVVGVGRIGAHRLAGHCGSRHISTWLLHPELYTFASPFDPWLRLGLQGVLMHEPIGTHGGISLTVNR